MPPYQNLKFKNRFIDLGPEFYQEKQPDPVTDPYLVDYSPSVGALIDLPSKGGADFLDKFSGNQPIEGARPLAMAYGGHQFGTYNPRLGDGRGLLLGEVLNKENISWDVHLKGAGPTRFARGFDGRATLQSSIREHLGSETLNGLGIPSTRSLAVIGIRELIYRQKPELAAILVRVADSHIRFGSFEYFHKTNQPKNVEQLAEFAIQNHHKDLCNEPERYRIFFRRVLTLTAKLIAKWQAVGFVHGVMNTDNMLLSGETVDYGPCAFMDTYDPETVFSSIDHGGRYAYRNQPGIAHWNLACLAQALVPIIDKNPEAAAEHAKAALDKFPQYFHDANIQGLRAKLGLLTAQNDDASMAQEFLDLLHEEQADFTLAFRRLAEVAGPEPELSVRDLFDFSPAFNAWLEAWRTRCASEGSSDRQATMLNTNPAIIPRNHLVEAIFDL